MVRWFGVYVIQLIPIQLISITFEWEFIHSWFPFCHQRIIYENWLNTENQIHTKFLLCQCSTFNTPMVKVFNIDIFVRIYINIYLTYVYVQVKTYIKMSNGKIVKSKEKKNIKKHRHFSLELNWIYPCFMCYSLKRC